VTGIEHSLTGDTASAGFRLVAQLTANRNEVEYSAIDVHEPYRRVSRNAALASSIVTVRSFAQAWTPR
jgi:hypothetical protein